MVAFGTVKEKEYFLLPTGEYCLTLSELEESEGQWGDRMIWKFMAAPTDSYADYICKPSGDEVSLWTFTDRDIILGSLAHEFVEALTGRKFGKDTPPPDEDDLLGKRLIAYVTHETPTKGKSAGKKRETIVAGSIKPFKGPQPNAVTRLDPKAAAPDPTADETAHAAAKAKVESLIGRAVKLGTPHHVDYVACDLDAADTNELLMLANTISDEVMAALDA